MAEFAVIGLGAFGRTVALELTRQGQSVLAIDCDDDAVQAISAEIDAAIAADATDEAALGELDLARMTCAVVAIGMESTESSILATALLRQMGVPRIVARAVSPLHARVLHTVGAHEVINPEESMGRRLAGRLAYPTIFERLELGDRAELAEIAVPETLVGKDLVELDLRREHGISALAIRRGPQLEATLTGREKLESGDILVVIGSPEAIAKFAELA